MAESCTVEDQRQGTEGADGEQSPPTDEQYLDSLELYARDFLKVQTKDGRIVPLVFNEVQVALNRILDDIRENGRLVRVVILKARRFGVSTAVAGRFFHSTATNPNTYTFMVTHEPDATEFVFGMHKRFYENLPKRWRPMTRYNNRKVLEFNRPDRSPGGLDSAIRVATAGKDDAGSAQLIHKLHLSELAKYPHHTAESLLTSVMQCVPMSPQSEVIIESTAKGIGGKFHDMYWSCRYRYRVFLDANGEIAWECTINEKASESNEYAAVFFPWYVFKEYEIPKKRWESGEGERFKRTEEEQEIVKTHMAGLETSIANRKLAWRRWAIENQCNGDVSIFNQEFPATDIEAFRGSGDTVFDINEILRLRENAPEPIMKYDLLPGTDTFVANQKDGKLWVWREPEPGRHYIIPADVSEGIEVMKADGKSVYDFSCADVLDLMTGKQVAQWHGHMAPDLFALLLMALGKRYNFGLLVPERNNDGKTVITTLMNARYPKIWVERVADSPGKLRKRYGWVTGRSSKPQMISNLMAEVREGTHGIMSKRTFDEMLTFIKREKGGDEKKLFFSAADGRFDDCVMSMAIGKSARLNMKLPVGSVTPTSAAEKIIRRSVGTGLGKRQAPNPGAWS